jgi:uroporphyrinogen III methyltransferase/synthase
MRGVACLEAADLVLYDALVHPDVLAHAHRAEHSFVGKRAGRPSARQTAIHERMLEAARAGRTVVRLKGGDPYLFGRGSEEAEFLHAHQIPFEVVPGVPSPVAATAYAGISLTHRELGSSVAYVTATESAQKDRTSHDWSKLATGPETLVIFMGLRRARSLLALLVEHGRDPETPAAAIQNASLPSQRTVVGTVADLADRIDDAGLGTPALLVVGPVVGLRPSLGWFEELPLFGKRVLVTRPSGQAHVLSALLRAGGAEPIEAPTICIDAPITSAPLVAAVAELHTYDWCIFTSRNGVERFFAEVARQGGDARKLGRARIAVIGPGTTDALAAFGLRPDHVPAEYRGEALADVIVRAARGDLTGARVLLPRAEVARDVVPETLRARGAHVDVVAAYRSRLPDADAASRLRSLLDAGDVDVITFTASSTVSNLVELLGARARELRARPVLASIGPITTDTATRLGLDVAVTATEYTNHGLVAALESYYGPDHK